MVAVLLVVVVWYVCAGVLVGVVIIGGVRLSGGVVVVGVDVGVVFAGVVIIAGGSGIDASGVGVVGGCNSVSPMVVLAFVLL